MVRKCILGVFAHPDDEVSGSGGTFVKIRPRGDGRVSSSQPPVGRRVR